MERVTDAGDQASEMQMLHQGNHGVVVIRRMWRILWCKHGPAPASHDHLAVRPRCQPPHPHGARRPALSVWRFQVERGDQGWISHRLPAAIVEVAPLATEAVKAVVHSW